MINEWTCTSLMYGLFEEPLFILFFYPFSFFLRRYEPRWLLFFFLSLPPSLKNGWRVGRRSVRERGEKKRERSLCLGWLGTGWYWLEVQKERSKNTKTTIWPLHLRPKQINHTIRGRKIKTQDLKLHRSKSHHSFEGALRIPRLSNAYKIPPHYVKLQKALWLFPFFSLFFFFSGHHISRFK